MVTSSGRELFVFLNNPEYKEINEVLTKIGETHNVNNEAASIAWLLRHPAKMPVILGTMIPARLLIAHSEASR